MGWMQKCIETYDHNRHMVGQPTGKSTPLAPLYFISQNAQIEVTITEEGEFINAESIPKDKAETLIPATEKSGQRSSGIAPHPLCDQLEYIALGHPDAPSYEQYAKKFEDYIKLLQKWAQSRHSHFIVEGVYRYIMGGTLISDLAGSKIVECEENGRLKKGKIAGIDYEKCLVRWRVKADAIVSGESWRNQELFDCYARFYTSELAGGKTDLCYVTGKSAPTAEGFPKGICKFANGAKLLSANDSSGFTYRGRFKDSGEAFSVSSEASQKAHAALTWLAANQGKSYGGRVFVCWNPEGAQIPSFDPDDLYRGLPDASPTETRTMPQYAIRLQKAIAGYRQELSDRTGVILMAMEAATTGRMSVTYYNELRASDYLDRLQSWQESCCWYETRFKKGEHPQSLIRSPSIKDIIQYAYGTEQTDLVKADDRLMQEHSQRILHCIVDAVPLPYDIVHAIVHRAALRQAYKDYNYEKLLFVACALIRKYRYDQSKKKEGIKMELDTANTDRSYLFGRLLAVAESVEDLTHWIDGITRETMAARLMTAFAAHPFRTWATIERALNASYYKKLQPSKREYFRSLTGQLLGQIYANYKDQLNQPLDDIYLIGFYLQREELKKSNKTENKIATESKEEN